MTGLVGGPLLVGGMGPGSPAPLKSGHAATDGRQVRLELPYVFQCSEIIAFRGY